MSGRGRGRGARGGGANKSFNKEQLSALGVGGGDVVPGSVTQPPPVYPPLERKPVPLLVCKMLCKICIIYRCYLFYFISYPCV